MLETSRSSGEEPKVDAEVTTWLAEQHQVALFFAKCYRPNDLRRLLQILISGREVRFCKMTKTPQHNQSTTKM